jgi:hypothetical protein
VPVCHGDKENGATRCTNRPEKAPGVLEVPGKGGDLL